MNDTFVDYRLLSKINHFQMFLEAAVLKNSEKFTRKESFYCSFLVNLQVVI